MWNSKIFSISFFLKWSPNTLVGQCQASIFLNRHIYQILIVLILKFITNPLLAHCQTGSLTESAHLSKGNAGVLSEFQQETEQKCKSWLFLDVHCEYGTRRCRLGM